MAINIQVQTINLVLNDSGFKIANGLNAIGAMLCFAIL